MFPEQYYAVTDNGDVVGYVRVRGGFACCYYPDDKSDCIIYEQKLCDSLAGIMTPLERKRNLPRIRRAILRQMRSLPSQTYNKIFISDGSSGEMLVDLIE